MNDNAKHRETRNSKAEFLIFQTEGKEQGVEVFYKSCQFAVVLSFIVPLFCGCSSKQKEDNKPQEQVENIVATPQPVVPVYHEPIVPKQVPPPDTADEVKPAPKPSPVEEKQSIPEVTISRYYEEGYDNGYDDGEDDAVMDNGWGGQYDDQCRYKGKKRKEYQLGYEEGYEAGYYDNKDSDE